MSNICTVLPHDSYTYDVYITTNLGYRMSADLAPHSDFSSPLGVGIGWLSWLAQKIAPLSLDDIQLTVLLAALLVSMLWMAVSTDSTLKWRLALASIIFFYCAVPRFALLTWAPIPTYAGWYNTVALFAVGVLCFATFQPQVLSSTWRRCVVAILLTPFLLWKPNITLACLVLIAVIITGLIKSRKDVAQKNFYLDWVMLLFSTSTALLLLAGTQWTAMIKDWQDISTSMDSMSLIFDLMRRLKEGWLELAITAALSILYILKQRHRPLAITPLLGSLAAMALGLAGALQSSEFVIPFFICLGILSTIELKNDFRRVLYVAASLPIAYGLYINAKTLLNPSTQSLLPLGQHPLGFEVQNTSRLGSAPIRQDFKSFEDLQTFMDNQLQANAGIYLSEAWHLNLASLVKFLDAKDPDGKLKVIIPDYVNPIPYLRKSKPIEGESLFYYMGRVSNQRHVDAYPQAMSKADLIAVPILPLVPELTKHLFSNNRKWIAQNLQEIHRDNHWIVFKNK